MAITPPLSTKTRSISMRSGSWAEDGAAAGVAWKRKGLWFDPGLRRSLCPVRGRAEAEISSGHARA